MAETFPNGSYETKGAYHYFDTEQRGQDVATALDTFESIMSGTPSSEEGSYNTTVDESGCYRQRTFLYTQTDVDPIDDQLCTVETHVALIHNQTNTDYVHEAYDIRMERRIKIARRHVLDASDEIGLVTERYVTNDPFVEQYSIDILVGGSVDAWSESSDVLNDGGYEKHEMTPFDFGNLQKCFAEVQALQDIEQRERDTIRMLTN